MLWTSHRQCHEYCLLQAILLDNNLFVSISIHPPAIRRIKKRPKNQYRIHLLLIPRISQRKSMQCQRKCKKNSFQSNERKQEQMVRTKSITQLGLTRKDYSMAYFQNWIESTLLSLHHAEILWVSVKVHTFLIWKMIQNFPSTSYHYLCCTATHRCIFNKFRGSAMPYTRIKFILCQILEFIFQNLHEIDLEIW